MVAMEQIYLANVVLAPLTSVPIVNQTIKANAVAAYLDMDLIHQENACGALTPTAFHVIIITNSA